MKDNNPQSISDQNTSVLVPFTDAMPDICHYVTECNKIFPAQDDIIKAYTIHAADLIYALGLPPETIGECTYTHVRAYLGLSADNKFKIFFTPVEGADLSIVPQKPGTDVFLRNEKFEQCVMDLNAPCPPTCDKGSPLNNPCLA